MVPSTCEPSESWRLFDEVVRTTGSGFGSRLVCIGEELSKLKVKTVSLSD
jgi:hypothetical protein